MTITFHADLSNGERLACAAEEGQSLLHALQARGVDLEGACDSSLACATCHVVVDPAWYACLPPPKSDETDMLDLAPGRCRTSRLSCQVKLTEAMDGLVVRVLK